MGDRVNHPLGHKECAEFPHRLHGKPAIDEAAGPLGLPIGQGGPRAKEPQVMLKNRLEDFWKDAASDGAASPIGPGNSWPGADIDEILDAWSVERSRCIESELLLDLSRKVLKRVLAHGEISDAERREVRGLIRAIGRSGRR